MLLQSLIVAILVACSASYAIWVLMPAAWRRPLAKRLLQVPALARQPALQRASRDAPGCGGGCDDCDAGSTSASGSATRQSRGGTRPIIIVRRSKTR